MIVNTPSFASFMQSPGATIKLLGLGTPVLIIMLLAMMVLPLPPIALDILFTFNIALSLLVLLASVYALRPLDFAVFPTILLIATLLRLALNLASTRVVLLNGHTGPDAAGKVIQAFGDFVVGGNYTVGLVVFSILVIINFVVVTKGAGRVSEVTARFTLDAMPGKQMAIDADMNAGVLSQDEARQRRADVAREADFYGSMDGASKFVRGDAIAGLLILFINVIGGLIIGMVQHDLSASVAAENYILLTIGDGLVAQIPALLLSTATAIVVTRVSDSAEMSEQIFSQLFSNARPFYITAFVVGSLGLVPGMPNMVFLSLAALMIGAGMFIGQSKQKEAVVKEEAVQAALPKPVDEGKRELDWGDVPKMDMIGLEVGYRLISLVDASTVIATHISQVLKEHAHEFLGHDEVQLLLDGLAKSSPKLVESLVPNLLSLGAVLKVMQNLLAEGIPVRDVRTIAEALAEGALRSQDPDYLTGMTRIALNRMIYQKINGLSPELEVMSLDPKLEQLLQDAIAGQHATGNLEPGLAEEMLTQISRGTTEMENQGKPAVLLVASTLRLWLARLVRTNNRGLFVLAYDEVPSEKQIKVVRSVGAH